MQAQVQSIANESIFCAIYDETIRAVTYHKARWSEIALDGRLQQYRADNGPCIKLVDMTHVVSGYCVSWMGSVLYATL